MKNNKNIIEKKQNHNGTKLKFTALIFAVCLAAVSMTACGENGGNSTASKNDESTIEETTVNKIESESVVENSDIISTEEVTADSFDNISTEDATADSSDSKYKPADEIINADFQSGLIQIGNDVFRNGGYYTVDQFIEEYGDRYDMSTIDTETEMNKDLNYATAVIISKSDPEIQISVEYVTPNQNVRTGDAVVVEVKPNRFTANGPFVCYPTGQKRIDNSKKFSDAEKLCEALGFKKLEDIDEHPNKKLYDAYGFVSDRKYPDRYIFRVKGTEENLFEAYPTYIYFIYGNDEHMITELNQMVYWKNLSNEYTSAKGTE